MPISYAAASGARNRRVQAQRDVTYMLRQWVGALVAPFALALLVAAVAALSRLGKRTRISHWLFGGAVAIAYIGSLDPVGNALLAPLEREYPPLRADDRSIEVRHIVVLGSSYSPRGTIPVTAALDQDGLARIVEGIRLVRLFPSATLVVSGGAEQGKMPPAQGYAALARAMGVSETSLIVLPGALNTGEEARSVQALLGAEPFLLVTSAFHMPRAMRFMQRAGARPIAAPTAQRSDRPVEGIRLWMPSSLGLGKSECALHEYVGLIALSVGAS